MKTFYLFVGLLIFLSGCASKTPQPHPHKKSTSPTISNQSFAKLEEESVFSALYNEYKQWNHTPYKYGGTSKYGVDCSSLVQQVYWNALRVSVPRTTLLQSKIGYRVAKHSAKTGDLLLFRTGYNTRHSGIYLKDGDFINASSSHGVTLSNLNNPYWRSKYWQTRRILP